MAKLCADCGQAGPWVTRPHRPTLCQPCTLTREHQRNVRRVHYRGPWQRLSRAIRTLPCARCGAPAAEAHHVTGRTLAGGVLPLCAPCHHAEHAK